MTSPRYAKLAGRMLASGEEVTLPAPTLESRSRAVEAIAEAIRERSRRRARARAAWAFGGVAAAAAIALVAVGLHARQAPPVVAASGQAPAPQALTVIGHASADGAMVSAGAVGGGSAPAVPLVDGAALGPGSRIVARPGAHAILAFSTGTRLSLEDGGELTLVDEGPNQVLSLARGAMKADVAKLGAHERFLVRTDDAEVEVRGTSFRVERVDASTSCDGSATRVSVFEGVVVVRHGASESRVGAGETWPACTPSAAAPQPVAAAKAHGARDESKASTPLHATPSSSSLAEQNDLFEAAVAAKRAGDAPLAVHRFDAFLARFPRSPLAESAEAQRMKLLPSIDPAGAADAARSYLAHHPDGFASDEARGILNP